MKKIKSFLFLLAALILFTASSITVSAAGNETPADIVARLTGRDVTDVIQEKLNTGKTYGTIAKEAGKLDEFKAECLELKEQILKENVANGLLSQDEADDILAPIKENQAICDGTGNGNCWNGTPGYGNGCGFGWNRNPGNGCGYGQNRNPGYNSSSSNYQNQSPSYGNGNGWNRSRGYGRHLAAPQGWRNPAGTGRGQNGNGRGPGYGYNSCIFSN